MEENLVRIPDQVIEQLRCSQCKEYLSCGPVRVLPDGTSICGQCSPPNSDIVVYRELILEESILKYAAFPCRFKMNGCMYKVAFGQALEHESKCIYQSYHCPLPVPNDETCSWSGLRSELRDHLTKNHSCCLLEAAHAIISVTPQGREAQDFVYTYVRFIIQVDQNCEGIFAVLKDDLVLLLTYSYLTSKRSLNYDVGYFNIDGAVSPSYTIDIQNNEVPDRWFSLEDNPCPIFGNCFNKLNNTLNLNKYMEALDNPNSIGVSITLKDFNKFALDTVKGTLTVDYEKLASLLCMMCHKEYLVFPIFEVGNDTVCFKCAYNVCSPKKSADMKLQQRIAATNFPCRWRSCNFIGTGDVILAHEISCQFRDYSCPICLALITATFAAKHLKSHGAQCVSEGGINLNSADKYPKYSFIVKNNKVIIVKHNNWYSGELLLSAFQDEQVIVQFRYPFCSRKSGECILSNKGAPSIDYTSMLSRCTTHHLALCVKLRSCK